MDGTSNVPPFKLLLAAFGSTLAAAAPSPSPAPYLEVPAGVSVAVLTGERLSSQDVKTGEPFVFETNAATQIGTLSLPAHTKGRGHIVFAESGRGAHAGKLSIAADEIDLPGGRIAVAIKIGDAPQHEGSTHLLLPIPVIANGSVVLVGPNRGDDNNVVIDKGTAFTVITTPHHEGEGTADGS